LTWIHFSLYNIFLLAHKNAYEPASSPQLWQNSGSRLLLAVEQIISDFQESGKLLAANVMAVVMPLSDTVL
jgi:hypothetical protein